MLLSRFRNATKTRRIACGAALAILGFLLVFGALRWRLYRESAARYAAIAAKLDLEDPGWRWEDIEAARPAIPEERNGFQHVASLIAAAPRGTSDANEPILTSWRRYPEKLPLEVADWAGGHLAAHAKEVEIARRLVDSPTGRHPIRHTEDFISTLLPTAQLTRDIANLMQWDCRVHASLGDFGTAVADLRAMRNAGRSFGDEPFLILALIRFAIDNILVQSMQEMLSMGEPPALALAALQRDLEEEGSERLLRHSMRGERAILLKSMQFFGRSLDMKTLRLLNGLAGPNPQLRGYAEWAAPYRYPPFAKHDQAVFLEEMTKLIAIADGPEERLLPDWKQHDADWKETLEPGGMPPVKALLSCAFLPIKWNMAEAQMRAWSLLRSSAAGIACERFRMATGHWPGTLEELVPKFIATMPNDPYTGKPLRYKRLADGIVVYAIGEDGVDDGGVVLNEKEGGERGDFASMKPQDHGFRLWDADRRGKSPLQDRQR